ncbi:MAG: ferritin [Carboxylicivirga sp.]|jgi:ferritin|nr:ferritin [Carboxylicivirga sp.]
MLRDTILRKLNEQIQLEHYTANLYLAMSSWCNDQRLNGSAKFLYDLSRRKMTRMYKLYNYVNETGSMAIMGAIDAPPIDYKNLKDVIERTFDHEKHLSLKINELTELSMSENDFPCFNFLQFFMEERHEKEALLMSMLDRIDIIGMEGRGVYMIDKELGSLVSSENKA